MLRLELEIEYSFDEESKVFIATLPGLGYVSSFGKTFAEAERNGMEAAQAYLEVLQKDGLPPNQTNGAGMA